MTLSPATFYDDNGVVRLQGQLDSSGGSQLAHGAFVTYDAGSSLKSSGDPIPFDTVQQDTDSYWDAVNHQFVIPASLPGLYVISIQAQVSDPADALSTALVILSTGIAAPNMFAVGPHETGADWSLSGCWVSYFGAGETIDERLSLGGAGSYSVRGGGYGFYSLARIGPTS